MSEIGTPGNHPFTIILSRMIGESWEDYAERCRQATNAVANLSPRSEPTTFDFSDTTKYRQIAPHAWELITPGYQASKEPVNERDTHFQGFAKLLWDEIYDQYDDLECSMDELAQHIEAIIAKRVYDLVAHCYRKTGALKPDMPYARPYRPEDIPDMIKWPKE